MLTLAETGLVITEHVGEVDSQPAQTSFAKRLAISEHEQATAEIVADVVKMRRHRIRATSEVHVMREIEALANISTRNLELIVDVTPLRVVGCALLIPLLEALQVDGASLDVVVVIVRLLRLRSLHLDWWHVCDVLARVPHLKHHVEDGLVDLPRRCTKDIKRSEDGV